MSSGRSRGSGPEPGREEALEEPSLLFQRLEQACTEEADHIKDLFKDNLRSLSGEAWLLNGLIDYYVHTGSARCLEILLSCGEGNSRALIDRLHQLLRSSGQRGAGLRLLGYYVRKHPVWLRKVVTQSSPSIVKDLFRIIKSSECEVQCIISASLVLTTLMPMFPVALIDHIQELFQVLSRLTSLVSTPGSHLGRAYQLHLHVATYSYFVRVYAMYPCNLLSFLRQHYGQRDNLPLFNRTIRPLLDHVRMHPLLVTGSNSTETAPQRWQRKETHDIVAECSHFSLDLLEASPMDNLAGPLWRLRPADHSADALGPTDLGLEDVETLGMHDILWSPVALSGAPRPLLAEGPDSAGSCETAVEATPDTTPAATPSVTPQRDLENPPLVRASAPSAACVQASRALSAVVAGGVARPRTADSIPSSPLKKAPATFRFGEAEMMQSFSNRMGQIMGERPDDGGGDGGERCAAEEAAPAPRQPAAGPSRLRERRPAGKNSPIKLKLGVVSPVQFSEGAPPVTRPVPRAPAGSCADPAAEPVHSAEDLEVSDLTRLAVAGAVSPGGSLTPFASTTAQLTQQHPLRHLTAPAPAPAPLPAAATPTAIPGGHRPVAGDDDEDAEVSPPPPAGLAASVPQSRFDFDLVRHMTRYYSRHVLPVRQYRRTSSCPDLAAADDGDDTASVAGSLTAVSGPRAEAATQTEDAHHPAPYEHLLTPALPPPPQSPQVLPSPHQLLLEHGQQTGPNGRLLHELLQYERYKREVHAHRNRRLFDRTRATGRLEEENRELKKQVQGMSVDVAECRRQLQLVKRRAERAGEEQRTAARRLEERAAADAAALAQLSTELEQQRHATGEARRRLSETAAELETARRQLLDTSRELDSAREKATRRAELQARVLDLERRLLTVGQLQRPCPPPAADPAAGGDRWALAAPPPPAAPVDEGRRRAEAVAAGLEQQVREKDLQVAELRRLLESARVRHHEQLQVLEDRYAAVKQHLQSAETRLLMSPPPPPTPPPPSSRHSNGSGDSPTRAPKFANVEPGTADLRTAVGDDEN